MDDIASYLRDPYLTGLDTTIDAAGHDGDRFWVQLADTVLYPEGGGQPSDRGTINGVAVVDVLKHDGRVRHFLAAPLEGGAAHVALDWARRFDHMQQHTGQHLLTAIAVDRFGWPTTAFHLGPEVSDIELATPAMVPARLAELEDAVAAEIRAARAVTTRWVAPGELEALGVRSRGLPDGHVGDVRLVGIEGIDLNTCGGTHLRSTAELELVKLLATEPMRGGTRLQFVAGGRARRRFTTQEGRLASLRRLLDAGDADLVATAELKLDQLRIAQRQVRVIESELAEALAASLATRDEAVVEAHFAGHDATFLQAIGRAFQPRAGHRLGFFTAARDGAAFFLLVAGEGCDTDVAALGRRIAEALGGKGGGAGRTFQGKAAALDARAEAVAIARAC